MVRVWGAGFGVSGAVWLLVACGSGSSGHTAEEPDATSPDGGGDFSDGAAVSDSGIEGAEGDASPEAAPVALKDLCPLLTRDLCIYLMQCSHAAYRDLAHCEAELDCFGLPQLQAAAAEGGVLYDPAKVGECNARFLAAPCDFATFLFTPDIFQVLALCPGTITPLLGAGAPCVASGECTQGLYCEKDAGCPGACTPYATVGQSCAGSARCDPALNCISATTGPFTDVCFSPEAGAACNGSCGSTEFCPDDASPCGQNFWCDSTSHTCSPGVGLDAACGPQPDGGWTVQCASNLWCSQLFYGQPGNCLAAGGAGAPCNDLGCKPGFRCTGYLAFGPDAGLGTCTGPSGAGGPCRFPSDCEGGAYCGNGTCGGGLAVGASCHGDTDCQAGLTCANGTCAQMAYPGDSCAASTSACVFSVCRGGTCADHAKVGQPCTMNTDCATGVCYQGTCFDPSVCPAP